MARCYSAAMRRDQPLPQIWLLSDARNDARLERVLAALPAQSGFVFRHYHLDAAGRRARFGALAALCRAQGHMPVLAGDAVTARKWGADGIYGSVAALRGAPDLLRLATVHGAAEIAQANRAAVDAMFLSPVFATRSHHGDDCLGIERFHALAALATRPVIALGGMDAARAAELEWDRWGAIDGHLR